MKLGSICYLPPPRVGHVVPFLENMRNFKSKYPILFYSDHPWKGVDGLVSCPDPECVKLAPIESPVPKYSFIWGARKALEDGFDYFITLEPDCRVGVEHWDDAIFNEFFTRSKPHAVNGGTIMAWFADLCTRFAPWYVDELFRKKRQTVTVPTIVLQGPRMTKQPLKPIIYANGALSVIASSIIPKAFGNRNYYLEGCSTWDNEIGQFLWREYGEGVVDVLLPMDTTWSHCNDTLTSEDQKKLMLTSKQVVAIHQIKSEWPGP